MIYVSEHKAQIVKGDFHPAELYKGNSKIAGYEKTVFEETGNFTLKNCYNDKICDAKIVGNCVQEETPSPENPVGVLCVGDLVTEGEHLGKYKIGATAYDDDGHTRNFDIYLDKPLCKIGEYEDYIDFKNKKVVRNTSIRIFTGEEGWYREDYRFYCTCGNRSGLKSAEVNCKANRYRAYPWNTIYRNSYLANKTIGIALQIGYLNVTPAQEIPTVADWKAQLSAWNDEGTPLTVVYADITREEEIDLPTLPTFKGTTTYEINTDIAATMSGTYKRVE